MNLLSIFFIATGLSMDSFAVCMSQGMCRQRFEPVRAAKVAFVFGFFQAVMPLIGFALGLGFSKWIASVDHWVAFAILGIIGGKMIYEGLRDEKEASCDCNCRQSAQINLRRVMALSFATSIDALAAGLIFVPFKDVVFTAVTMIGIVCFVFCFAGIYLGIRFGKNIQINMVLIGGLILIAIGLKILAEHLLSV